MLLPHHVYIFNRYHTDLLMRLNILKDVSVGAMRRGATMMQEILLKRSRSTDITKAFNVPRDTALEAIKTSPDYVRWSHMIDILDADDRPVDFPIPTEAPAFQPVAPPQLGQSAASRQAEVRAKMVAQRQRDKDDVEEVEEVEVVMSGTDLAKTGELEKTVDPLALGDPSITWSRQDLERYANAVGVKILATHTKAAILRKIRDATK